MKNKLILLLVLPLALLLAISGCEGPEGPAGPIGEQGDKGDKGDPISQYTYLGDNATTCAHCHGGMVDGWLSSAHASTYEKIEAAGRHTDVYCLSCHTTGFDSPVSRGDTLLTERGPNPHGFDDYFPPQTEEDHERIQALKSVQCEACHGTMGPTIYNHRPMVEMGSNETIGENSLCTKCHSSQIDEWAGTAHGSAVPNTRETLAEYNASFNRPAPSDCWTCHTTEGFIHTHTPSYAGRPQPAMTSTVGCVACHDPHNGNNPYQLRTLANRTTLNTTHETMTFSGYGTAQLCVHCHRDRRDGANVASQIERGTSHFGPHYSNQMDMFLGVGSYEIEGYTYNRTEGAHKVALDNACVSCHVSRIARGPSHKNHSFEIAVENCQSCHPGANDLDYRGVQTEIANLLTELKDLIGVEQSDFGNANLTTPEQRMAAYAYNFVYADGSKGIHNYRYAKSLLENAIDYLNNINLQADAGN